MIGDRWFMLAARYVTAIEATAVATERIAATQERSYEITLQIAKTSARSADTHARMLEMPSSLVLPELGSLVEAIAGLAAKLVDAKADMVRALGAVAGHVQGPEHE